MAPGYPRSLQYVPRDGALPTDRPHSLRPEVPLRVVHQVPQEVAAGGRRRPPAADRAGHLLGVGGRPPQGPREPRPCPPLRLLSAARLAELPDAADQGEVVTEAVTAVQPPEQGVLGPSPVGPRVL